MKVKTLINKIKQVFKTLFRIDNYYYFVGNTIITIIIFIALFVDNSLITKALAFFVFVVGAIFNVYSHT